LRNVAQEDLLGLLAAFVYEPVSEWIEGDNQRRDVEIEVAMRLLTAHVAETQTAWVSAVSLLASFLDV
jgi:hypothetical protein